MTVSHAIESDDGELLGVIGMDIKLHRFSDIINAIRFGDDGYIMLVSDAGDIFSHPDRNMLMSSIYDDAKMSSCFNESKGKEVACCRSEDSIISFISVPGTGWRLVGVTSFDMKQIVAPIKHKVIQVAFISIIFTFIIGFFLARLVTEPLSNFMKVINRISQGRLDEHIYIDSNDEFKVLGDQFNNMMNVMMKLIAERNANVEELTKKNQEILAQSEKIRAYSEQKEIMNEELSRHIELAKKSYLSTVKSLANAIEASDKYTRGHCERVANISLGIARSMGASDKQLEILEIASILHDIGKIGVPTEVLNKEGMLTKLEFDLIKSHPEIGHDILADIDFIGNSKDIILQHHERADGKGYPRGIKGDEMLFLSKIIAVADAYDAMTSSRPYRKIPLTKNQAIKELLRNRGTQFDEEVTDYFLDLLMMSSINF